MQKSTVQKHRQDPRIRGVEDSSAKDQKGRSWKSGERKRKSHKLKNGPRILCLGESDESERIRGFNLLIRSLVVSHTMLITCLLKRLFLDCHVALLMTSLVKQRDPSTLLRVTKCEASRIQGVEWSQLKSRSAEVQTCFLEFPYSISSRTEF